jgi:hypothetical protein
MLVEVTAFNSTSIIRIIEGHFADAGKSLNLSGSVISIPLKLIILRMHRKKKIPCAISIPQLCCK